MSKIIDKPWQSLREHGGQLVFPREGWPPSNNTGKRSLGTQASHAHHESHLRAWRVTSCGQVPVPCPISHSHSKE